MIDATAVPADRGGVGRYVDELLPALDELGERLVVVCQRRDVDHYTALLPGAEVVGAPGWAAPVPGRLVWEQVALPLLARRRRVALLHSPHYTFPLLARVPVVVTLHDATFSSHPEAHSRVKARFFRTWTRWALSRAAACVVPSEATRDELRRVVGPAAARVTVARLGVDPRRFHPPSADERAALRAHLDLGDTPFVSFLGTLEPRKNVPALVRGWVRACERRPHPPVLVLAGGPGWDDGVAPALAEVPAGLRVVRAGYLPLELLPALLGDAEVVVYPSVGEGFGLPVVEAMACGAAVLTTRVLSLPEVGGDAVAYTGTTAEEIGTELAALLDDAPRRAELGRAAVRRAAGFTWRACAERHRTAYDAASAGGGADR